MGFRFSVLLYTHANQSAPSSPADVMARLFPRTTYEERGIGSLEKDGFPARGDIFVGTFERGTLVATRDAALFNPAKLHKRYLRLNLGTKLVLVTQQPVYDMFAYAQWVDGQLRRSISVNPVGKIWESIGDPAPFEEPFWAGERPSNADYPLPFHPLDMGEAAAAAELGVCIEGPAAPGLVEPGQIRLHGFTRGNS